VSGAEAAGIGFPKALEVDKDDVKAVRGFFPGKLLSRTAALLSLVMLVLGFAVGVNKEAEQLLGGRLPLSPSELIGLLVGTPMLVVTAQVAIEWLAGRDRRALQLLALQPASVPQGYFRIGPYQDTPEDRAKFTRADRAQLKVLDWIKRSTSMPIYLTGDSGSGKSSLLNACVIPSLRDAGWSVVEARAWQDPETALREAITRPSSNRRSRSGENKDLRQLIEGAADRDSGGLLLVLDQFEEFVILGKPEQQQSFAALLAALRSTPARKLRLLLSLRSDYQTLLEDLGLPALRQGENYYQVGRFTLGAAGHFMAGSDLGLQPEALERLLNSAALMDETPGLVRPITLNVLGYVLASGLGRAASLDAGQLVRLYIHQTLSQPGVRDYAASVLETLITERGTKQPRSEADIVARSKLRRGEVRGVLNALSNAALARPLDPAHGVWELSHDFVAGAVARFLGRRRRDLLSRSPYYAAPALLIAALLSVAGLAVWSGASRDRRINELSDLGFTITTSDDGQVAAVRNSRLTNDNAERAFSRLASLAGIVSLDLSGSDIESVEPISKLVSLRNLDLHGTRVASLGPLRTLPGLQTLNLSATKVQDLRPLEKLSSLRSLNLDETLVVTLEPLRELTGLQSVSVLRTLLDDIEPIHNLTKLRALNVNSTRVRNLEPLKGLTELQTLDLGYTFVESLQQLGNLPALHSLDISGDTITNFEPLSHLTGLRSLTLNDSNIPSLEPLRGETSLRSLGLISTRIRDLQPLTALSNLEELNLTQTAVDSLAPLEDLPKLSRLTLRGARIDSLEPLRQLHFLRWLDLGASGRAYPVRLSLDPLKELTALRFLDLSWTQFDTIDPLRNLTKLEKLSLVGIGGLKTLEPIQDLPNLTTVYIWRNAVPDEEFDRFRRYREEKKLRPVAMM
jgi:hypothetical protein